MKALKIALSVTIGFFSFANAEEPVEPGFNEATFKGLEFRGIGPAFMSGRIADLAIDPTDPSVWYVAVGSGGVWKTVNASTTWTPIFDDQGSYSIGCITLDPNNPNTVWVGTGENVSGRHVGYGDGVVSGRAERLQEGTWIPPSSLHTELVRTRPDGHLFNTIGNGIRNMPGYASQIGTEDRWAIVAYVRALQRSQNATIDDVPPELRAQLR